MKTRILGVIFPAAFVSSAAGQAPEIGRFEAVPGEVLAGDVTELRWEVSGADSLEIDQGVGEVAADAAGAGAVTVSPSVVRALVPRGSTWRYIDGGGVPPAGWEQPDFDDGSWAQGPAQLGYGDGDEATPLDFGGDAANKAISYYFRHRFTLDAGDLAEVKGVTLDLLRDDGAAVFLNGVEVGRSNLPAGDLAADTTALVAQGGGEETSFFRFFVDANRLAEGENVIAVQVHQANGGSSDVSFDLSLDAHVPASAQALLPKRSVWRYLDDGSDPGPGWFQPGFDDGAWASGPGDLGYDDNLERTTVSFGDDPAAKPITTYFRSTFSVTDLAGIAETQFDFIFDDGAALYINDQLVTHPVLNLPAGIPVNNTLALSERGPGDEEVALSLIGPGAFGLVDGVNTIAVEVHLSAADSPDMRFDLRVSVNRGSVDLPVFDTVLPFRSTWRYLDDGTDPGAGWAGAAFDDGAWAAGAALFGYGLPGDRPATVVDFGPDAGNKFLTTYFRREIDLPGFDPATSGGVVLQLRRDDGAAVFINGEEVLRDGLPAGPLTPQTTAVAAVTGADENRYFAFSIPPDRLRAGTNTLAVEVHQSSGGSSDLLFDLSLLEVAPADSVTYSLTATNAEGSTTRTVTVDTFSLPDNAVVLTGSGQPWDSVTAWSDGEVASAGRNYFVYSSFAAEVTTPPGEANPAFAGDALELNGPAGRLTLAHASGPATVDGLRLRGGTVALSLSALDLGLNGGVEVAADSALELTAAGQQMTIGSQLSGPGRLTVRQPPGATPRSSVVLTAANPNFFGGWRVENALLHAAVPGSLGPGDIHLEEGGLDVDYNIVSPAATFSLFGVETTLVLDQDHTFGGFRIGTTEIGPGTYRWDFFDNVGIGGQVVDGGGSITVLGGGVEGDEDGDGLDDDWELAFFGGLQAAPEGDFDSDGSSNRAEFVAGTSPVDETSLFTAALAPGAAPDEPFVLSWPSVDGRLYIVQSSGRADGGFQPEGPPVIGTGGTLTWADAGAAAAAAKFYRVQVIAP